MCKLCWLVKSNCLHGSVLKFDRPVHLTSSNVSLCTIPDIYVLSWANNKPNFTKRENTYSFKPPSSIDRELSQGDDNPVTEYDMILSVVIHKIERNIGGARGVHWCVIGKIGCNGWERTRRQPMSPPQPTSSVKTYSAWNDTCCLLPTILWVSTKISGPNATRGVATQVIRLCRILAGNWVSDCSPSILIQHNASTVTSQPTYTRVLDF